MKGTWILERYIRGQSMAEKKTLKINLDELCEAMENSSYENEYYLNLETGEILFLSEYMDDEETEKLRERLDDAPDHYEPIPKAKSHAGYEDMRDFIATMELAKLNQELR